MHKIQEKILKLLENQNLNGLTLRQIAELVEEKFPQKIKHHLTQLQNKGLIKINSKTKTIEKIFRGTGVQKNLINVPIVGTANCGPATIFANDNIEGYLKISKNILKKCKRIFAIKARGLSMNNAIVDGKNIEDGDYLIIDSEDTNPKNGDVVLSVIDDMANIKKYIWDDDHNQVVLVSQSTKDIPPIYIHEDDSFMINGKVIQVIKKPKMA
ncbi:MAG TPA: S24 family peptidase [Candidatus Paceibacterota bacterium]|nr:S24 family peptidase [Candidatus Paceibacterota bacterium]